MKGPASHALPYRSEIDGLRAIAVLAVVAYHFGMPLRGGFVGVDIFFVISGFLIGGILWREYDRTGRVALVSFYARRFRRLMPAFFAMAVVTTLLCAALLLPFEYRDYGKSLIAATVYLSNVLFYRQAGYFDSAAEDKPLLHTWSLAVEEQFYIFLPLLILVFARWRWGLVGTLAVLWLISLAACILLTPQAPTATFYLFPFRAWELLSGVLLAIWGHQTGVRWRGPALLSWVGFTLVLGSLVFIPAGPGFPGALAIPPVLGTVLILATGLGRTPVNRLLCQPIMVFFGLISYSLYLWHWPIFTLSDYLRAGYSSAGEALVWMALSVAVAWLSWRFVEQPVRRARNLPRGTILGGAALASVVTLAAGGLVYTRDGLPNRFGPEAQVHIAATGDFLQDWSRCSTPSMGPFAGLETCALGPEVAPEVLVWGDSHVRALREGLARVAEETGTPGLIIWRAGCPPVFGIRKSEQAATPTQDAACDKANLQIARSLGQMDSIERILLVGRWNYYTTGEGIGFDEENRITLFPTEGSEALPGQDQPALLERAARATVAALLAVADEVFVLRQPPEQPSYDSRIAARETAHARLPLAAAPRTHTSVAIDTLAERKSAADAIWEGIATDGGITLIDPWPRLCDETRCFALHNGVGQYFDTNHLTNSAALRIRDLFTPVMTGTTRDAAMADPDFR